MAADSTHAAQQLASAAPMLTTLLKGADVSVVEQAAWALGNLVVDTSVVRQAVLASGAVPALARVFLQSVETATRDAASLACTVASAWACSALLRGHCDASQVEPTLEPAAQLAMQLLPELDKPGAGAPKAAGEPPSARDAVFECLWLVAYLSATSDACAHTLAHNESYLLLLRRAAMSAIPMAGIPGVRALGNVCCIPDSPAPRALLADITFTRAMHTLLSAPFISAGGAAASAPSSEAATARVQETLWFISNLAGCGGDIVDAMLSAHFFQPVMQHFATGKWHAALQAGRALLNMGTAPSPSAGPLGYMPRIISNEQARARVKELLGSGHVQGVQLGLSFCSAACDADPAHAPALLDGSGIREALTSLVYDGVDGAGEEQSEQLSSWAEHLLDAAFNAHDEAMDEDAACAPEATSATFSFGLAPSTQASIRGTAQAVQPAWATPHPASS